MKKFRILISLLLIGLAAGVFAQSLNDAGAAFNEGIRLSKEDQEEAAIESYKQCISICEQLGEEGTDLKMKSQQQIANLYSNLGVESYKSKKPDQAIGYFEEALNYAEKAGDERAIQRTNKYMNFVYTYKGNVSLKEDAYDEAVKNLNRAITYNPDNIKTYYSLGLAYMKMDDEINMKTSFDKVISMGGEDDSTVEKAKTAASKYYIAQAAQALKNGNNEETIRLVNERLNYSEGDGNAYYFLALAYNNTSQYDNAVEAASKGIAVEGEDASNLHFEAARAFEAKNDNAKACEHYKQVNSGPNVEAAKYQMETVLKCN